MSADLPDDPPEWPADPFELLGVPRGSDDDAIRRAYTKLLKRFKPEHAPDEFRRIRDAYEACLQQTGWFRDHDDEPAERPIIIVPEARPPDAVDLLWNQAVAGHLELAYAGLTAAYSESVDVALRLYWLLALEPTLDAQRSRHHWLADALRQSHLSGAAVELYRRELEHDPLAALNEPYDRLAETDAAIGPRLAYVRLRIAAAGRLGRSSFIEADLDAVRPRLGLDDDLAWLGTLVAVHDWTIGQRPAMLLHRIEQERPRLRHLELHNSYYFDRLEQGEFWTGELLAAKNLGLAANFVDAVAMNWAGGVSRGDLLAAVQPLIAMPEFHLTRLDRLREERGRGFALLACQVLERFDRSGPDYPPDLARGLARRLAASHDSTLQRRLSLFSRLVAEGVSPEEFAAACVADPERRFRQLGETTREDLELRVLWLAATLSAA